ncbi:hypothetical protein LZP69_13165 [Shewanella sp. AS1]|uniref:hypothetical protein n=1 Tax=Shewanella sp. AS1 TaxID=2907626 RepID=UPI001F15B002|nr:hypothetical protein [Shewanella sp. AS1]MCE9680114.1 hypothetical protein [Shewanella sp. AS1]
MLRLYCYLTVLILGFSSILVSSSPVAKEHKVLRQKADAAEVIAHKTEQEQLEKARQAAKVTQAREQALLKSQGSGWEEAQRQKAQQDFNQRQSREEKYLQEAKKAANQERKLPKP